MSDSGVTVVIVGAGVSGLVAALALAEAGITSTVLDRDDAPPPAEAAEAAAWVRRGVAQFQQPHAFLARLRSELEAALPAVVPALLAAGAVDLPLPAGMRSLWCRRSTLEWTLRQLVETHPLIAIKPAAARDIQVDQGRVTGLCLADGTILPATLVIDATGRRGRFSERWSELVTDEPTNEVYTSRRYRLRPGAEFGPINRGVIAVAESDAYTLLIFPHDAGTFTVTFTRLPSDHDLAELRHVTTFESAVAQVPLAALWTDADRAEPISDVMVMSGLRNVFRPLSADAPLGLEAIGDAVSTSNPHFGRGSSMSSIHALRLAAAVSAHPAEPCAWRRANRAWVEGELRNWFDDGVALDAMRAMIWRSVAEGASPEQRRSRPKGLPRLFILAAAGADPLVAQAVMRHMHLVGSPDDLDAVAPRVQELLASGWFPGMPAPGAAPPPPLFMAPRRVELLRALAVAGTAANGRAPAAAWDVHEQQLAPAPV